MASRAVRMGVTVATRTVTTPAFGAWLRTMRGDRSLEQIAQKLRPLVKAVGLKVDQSLLYKIEQGRVPSWPMVGALSRVYDVPVGETVERLRTAVVFPGSEELFSTHQAGEKTPSANSRGVVDSSLPSGGGAHASPRVVRSLGRELAERERVITDAQAAAVALLAILAPRAEVTAPDLSQPRRRPPRGKAR